MSSLINDPEAHRPHGPRFGYGYNELDDISPAAFYQPVSAEQRRAADRLPEQLQDNPDLELPIDSYQAWCETNWKEPHGTIASVERSAAKLLEEAAELTEEIYAPEHAREAAKIISELGDVLWCTSAVASDLSVNIKHGLMALMNQYGRNIRTFDDHGTPAWVKKAQVLAFDETLKTQSLDELVAEGFQSEEAAIMLVDEVEITDAEIHDAISHIDINSKMLITIARHNYEDDLYQTGAVQQAEVAEYMVAKIFVDVAFLAKHAAGSSFSEVVKHNIAKISGRVENNRVDKSDGQRSEEDS